MTYIAMSHRYLRAYFAAILIGSVGMLSVPQAHATQFKEIKTVKDLEEADKAERESPDYFFKSYISLISALTYRYIPPQGKGGPACGTVTGFGVFVGALAYAYWPWAIKKVEAKFDVCK